MKAVADKNMTITPNTLAEVTGSTLNMALDQVFSDSRFDHGFSDSSES